MPWVRILTLGENFHFLKNVSFQNHSLVDVVGDENSVRQNCLKDAAILVLVCRVFLGGGWGLNFFRF